MAHENSQKRNVIYEFLILSTVSCIHDLNLVKNCVKWDDEPPLVDQNVLDTQITYQMDSSVHLVQESDGVRIISNETHELLQRVPS